MIIIVSGSCHYQYRCAVDPGVPLHAVVTHEQTGTTEQQHPHQNVWRPRRRAVRNVDYTHCQTYERSINNGVIYPYSNKWRTEKLWWEGFKYICETEICHKIGDIRVPFYLCWIKGVVKVKVKVK